MKKGSHITELGRSHDHANPCAKRVLMDPWLRRKTSGFTHLCGKGFACSFSQNVLPWHQKPIKNRHVHLHLFLFFFSQEKWRKLQHIQMFCHSGNTSSSLLYISVSNRRISQRTLSHLLCSPDPMI